MIILSKKNKIIFLMFLIMFLLSNIVYGLDYADIKINILETGDVTIFGLTNNELLKNYSYTQDLTSKEGKYWIFNLTTQEVFSDYIFELNLPKNTEVNYLNTKNIIKISNTKEGLSIIGNGKNETFKLIVQYKINKKINEYNPILLIIIIIFIIILFGTTFYVKRKKQQKQLFNRDLFKIRYLEKRQQQIIQLLLNNKNEMLQSELEKIMNIPKSSLSRNIESLKRKGIVKKIQKGMSNLIIINEDYNFKK
jgi:uncharacterized membrane protein